VTSPASPAPQASPKCRTVFTEAARVFYTIQNDELVIDVVRVVHRSVAY
jgi:hypothetical protein